MHEREADHFVCPSAGHPGARRMAKVIDVLSRTLTIHSDDEVVDAYAERTAECRRTGHPLRDNRHTGDHWIAAFAIAKRFDLASGDAIYRGAPNVVMHR